MGLFIAQSEGPFASVKGYDFAIAGAEYNVAIGAARLGHSVSYLTKLGRDPFGEAIHEGLRENGIETDSVLWSDVCRTGFMLKSRVSQGDPDIFYFRAGSAASTLSPEDVADLSFSEFTHVHVTGILPALSKSTRAAAEMIIDQAKESGAFVSFDPNIRQQLWNSTHDMIETINSLASKADLVLPGIAEGKILTGYDNPQKINAFYLSLGAKASVTKCGGSGALWTDGTNESFEKGFPVKKVVDTVGAGDGFATGVITALMEGMTLSGAVQRGNAIGALQVMNRGDNDGLPTVERLKEFMQEEDGV